MEQPVMPPAPGFEDEKYPREFKVNDRLTIRVGYRDNRAVISWNTRIPLVGWIGENLAPADLPLVERVMLAQREWVELSKKMGGKVKAPVRMKLSGKTTAAVGFEDRHVELAVNIIITNYVIALAQADAPRVEEAFAFWRAWTSKTEAERFIKGAE